MNRIEVDFNNRGTGGAVRGSLRRAGNIKVNDTVTIVDSDEGMEFEALVIEVDAARGRVLYAPLWERVDFEEALGIATENALVGSRVVSATAGGTPRVRLTTTLPQTFGPFALPRPA